MSCSTQKPLSFKRGSTFSFMFAIPATIPDGFFVNWLPKAQIRKARSSGPSGLIAELECFWNDTETTRYIIVRYLATEDWPIGRAEMDIRLESTNGEHIQTSSQEFVIERGITR